MNCKHCQEEYKIGYGSFCSRSCCNKSRGPRSEEVKRKIKEANIKRAKERDENYYDKIREANRDYRKIQKGKETCKLKRDYSSACLSSIKRWLKEEIRNCENCGVSQWQGTELSLEVHHVDGNTKNNRKENLQVLCPNCHSVTPNWRRRKQG